MGITDGSRASNIDRGSGWVQRVMLIVLVILFVLVGVLAYRSAGYVGINASYNCVEDVISYVDRINLRVDVDEGYFTENPLAVSEEARDYASKIEDRGGCVSGFSRSLMSALIEKREAVDLAANNYLLDVAQAGETIDADTVPYQTDELLAGSYAEFLDAIDEFEEEVGSTEVRFLLRVK